MSITVPRSGWEVAANWIVDAVSPGVYFGWSVCAAGDVDGDGYADLLVGAWGANGNIGLVYLYRGGISGLDSEDYTALSGENPSDYFGYAVSTAGDLNGDGRADFLVGASGFATSTGRLYAYYGSGSYPYAELAWTAEGIRGADHFASAVSTAGDVNGDGYSDVLVGAWGHDEPGRINAGRVYLYHGAAAGVVTTPAWEDTGTAEDYFGSSVASAGDVNGDGYSDVIVGASVWHTGTGKAYVYYGSITNLSEVPDWTAEGENLYDHFGNSVASAGDVNGDGYADVIVGAPDNDDYGNGTGKAYIYYGSALGLKQPEPGQSSPDPDWVYGGEGSGDRFGYAVASAGDVNGDGYADVVVGAEGYPGGARHGKVYLFYGSALGLSSEPDWTAVGEGSNDYFGMKLASAGDVNGDSFSDVVIGSLGDDAGRVNIYHGSAAGLSHYPDWTAWGEAPGNSFGSSVASAGDINSDGYADLLVGALGYDNSRGKIYIYHGSLHGLDVPYSTINGGDQYNGLGEFVSTAGDVNGDGFADIQVSAAGYYTGTGQVMIYEGSASGVDVSVSSMLIGENENDYFGLAVATAGDVNGDGFSDVIIGTAFYPNLSRQGKAYLFLGNRGVGRPALAAQQRGDVSGEPVQPWGPSYTPDGFQVSLQAVHPLGRGDARLQVQACPSGVPFGHAACLETISPTWLEVVEESGVVLRVIVDGLDEGTLYRWRARALYDNPFYIHGPWRRLQAQSNEADVRSTRLAADLQISKTMAPAEPTVPGTPITFTLHYSTNGPAFDVTITDILPAGLSDPGFTSSGAVITDSGQVPGYVWQVADLAPGEGGVITITAVAQAERFLNTASISSSSPDPNLDNNTASVQTHMEGVIFVDRDARGTNDGSSWVNAYTDLQDALGEAISGDQVWVAEGIYNPTNSITRTLSFELTAGVAIHGGFAGTEKWLYERDRQAHTTILSGDIGTLNNLADNAYHVVASSGVTETAVLEGFIITAGNANGQGADGMGGGLYNDGSPTLLNLTFIGNRAENGGALYNASGNPTLFNIAFSGNTASSNGGGLYNASGSPQLVNTTFSRNAAGLGGGIYNDSGSPLLENSILWGNTPGQIGSPAGVTINNSDIQGGCPAGAACTDVIAADPQFIDVGRAG